jgi:hypothetical protein
MWFIKEQKNVSKAFFFVKKKGNCGGVELTQKGAAPRRRTNVQMVQNVLLIWLDNNSADCRNTVT